MNCVVRVLIVLAIEDVSLVKAQLEQLHQTDISWTADISYHAVETELIRSCCGLELLAV